MFTQFETTRYRLNTDRMGFYELIRLADNASAYFQGDDADLWRRNMSDLEALYRYDEEGLTQSFNCLCESYDEVLDVAHLNAN